MFSRTSRKWSRNCSACKTSCLRLTSVVPSRSSGKAWPTWWSIASSQCVRPPGRLIAGTRKSTVKPEKQIAPEITENTEISKSTPSPTFPLRGREVKKTLPLRGWDRAGVVLLDGKGNEMAVKAKVVLTDYVWESLDVEKKILAGLAELVPLQTKKPEDFIAQAADCDAVLNHS